MTMIHILNLGKNVDLNYHEQFKGHFIFTANILCTFRYVLIHEYQKEINNTHIFGHSITIRNSIVYKSIKCERSIGLFEFR